MSKHFLHFIACAGLALTACTPVTPLTPNPGKIIDYGDRITACNQAAEWAFETGVTSHMLAGSLERSACLRQIIVAHIWSALQTTAGAEAVDAQKKIVLQAEEKILADYHQSESKCLPTCGTMMPLLLAAAQTAFYEAYITAHSKEQPLSAVWQYDTDFDWDVAF